MFFNIKSNRMKPILVAYISNCNERESIAVHKCSTFVWISKGQPQSKGQFNSIQFNSKHDFVSMLVLISSENVETSIFLLSLGISIFEWVLCFYFQIKLFLLDAHSVHIQKLNILCLSNELTVFFLQRNLIIVFYLMNCATKLFFRADALEIRHRMVPDSNNKNKNKTSTTLLDSTLIALMCVTAWKIAIQNVNRNYSSYWNSWKYLVWINFSRFLSRHGN